jgi:hypothetical protein
MQLCPDDAHVEFLRRYLKCNILRVPSARIVPLAAVSLSGDQVTYYGLLHDLVADAAHLNDLSKPTQVRFADLQGVRSKSVNTDVGLAILDGYLNSFSIPTLAIECAIRNASGISFAFTDVYQIYFTIGNIGKALAATRMNLNNPACAKFISQEAQLLLVDSIIACRHVNIDLISANQSEIAVDVKPINALPTEIRSRIKLDSSNQSKISFSGRKPLCFACSLLRLEVSSDGAIATLAPERRRVVDLRATGELMPETQRIIHGLQGAPLAVAAPERMLLSYADQLEDIQER